VICVETRQVKNLFILLFKDTGEGIPPEMLDHIWDPFEKHPRSTGAGIGLSLVKQMTESMGGTISVSSEPDCGACFQLSFPLSE
jgi:signal transduction histidine kinase